LGRVDANAVAVDERAALERDDVLDGRRDEQRDGGLAFEGEREGLGDHRGRARPGCAEKVGLELSQGGVGPVNAPVQANGYKLWCQLKQPPGSEVPYRSDFLKSQSG
jgi:hypothetical protein